MKQVTMFGLIDMACICIGSVLIGHHFSSIELGIATFCMLQGLRPYVRG